MLLYHPFRLSHDAAVPFNDMFQKTCILPYHSLLVGGWHACSADLKRAAGDAEGRGRKGNMDDTGPAIYIHPYDTGPAMGPTHAAVSWGLGLMHASVLKYSPWWQ